MFPKIRYNSTQAKLDRTCLSRVFGAQVFLYSLYAEAHSGAFGKRGEETLEPFGFRPQPSLWIKYFWAGEDIAIVMKGSNAHPNNGLFVKMSGCKLRHRPLNLHHEVPGFHKYADPGHRLAWEEEIRNHETIAEIP